jgi:chemotaxis response regulator CheB
VKPNTFLGAIANANHKNEALHCCKRISPDPVAIVLDFGRMAGWMILRGKLI